LSSYPAGIIADQKGYDIGDIRGLSNASHGRPWDEHRLELGLMRDKPVEHVRFCRSDQHGIDRNSTRSQFIRAHEREWLESGFAPAIDA
jgi:hypothetical protein